MGMIKKSDMSAAPAPVNAAGPVPTVPKPQGRDFEKEAVGKTRCALLEAAITGLGPTAGMTTDWNNEESVQKFVSICVKVADAGVKYVFEGR